MFREITAGCLLEEQADSFGDSRFLTFAEDGRTWTYSEFNAEVNRLAHGLAKLGVQRGDRIGITSPNRPEYMFASFAIRKLGAIEVGINGELRGSDLDMMYDRAQPRFLLHDSKYNENLATSSIQPASEGIISLGSLPSGLDIPIHGYESIRNDNTENPDTCSDDTDLSMMMLSGGTTGVSKGIIGSHRYVNCFSHGVIRTYSVTKSDRVYAPWPLHHATSSALDVNTALIVGAEVVLAPRFSASRLMDDFINYETTWMSALGIFQKIMWNMPRSEKDKVHKMRFIWGAPLPVPGADFKERFGFPIHNCYGSTDAGMIAFASNGDPDGCGGVVREEYEVSIADERDNSLPAGQVGEILVRPRIPDIMPREYFNQPDLTVETRRNFWFHTGDLGFLDEDNRLTFTERTGIVIRRRGEFISHTSVEHGIEAHQDVYRSAVIGVDSEMGEQDIAAFVVLNSDSTVDAEILRKFCKETMARWMVPDHVFFVDEIPTSEANKPIVPRLRELYDELKGGRLR